MEYYEQSFSRFSELQPDEPAWAKAERMEYITPQSELWHLSSVPVECRASRKKRINAGTKRSADPVPAKYLFDHT